jgi:iron complex outermembrane receptor protein
VFSGFLPAFAGSHERTNLGVYADLESELARYFLVNVAARFESYSDFGSGSPASSRSAGSRPRG